MTISFPEAEAGRTKKGMLMKKRIISLCLAVTLLLAMLPQIVINADAAEVIAEGTCGDNLTWILDDEGRLTISGTGKMTSYAFEDSPWKAYAANIETVVLNSGVTNISTSAFSNCTNLSKIEMPETLTEIRDTAFYNCTSLISFTIPKGVESIGGGAFLSCTNLSDISVSEGNTNFYVDEFGVLYTGDMSVILWTPSSLSNDYKIPDTVVEIEEYTFENCTNITSVIIPSSVTDIGMGAFTNCTKLSSVYFMGDYPYLGSSFMFINAKATAYYPSDNETWDRDIIYIVGINEWVAYEYPNYDGFWLDKDGWSFANSSFSFREDSESPFSTYYIPEERYDEVFGSAYLDSNKFSKKWGGNCAGMSTTAILFFLDYLAWQTIDDRYPNDFSTPNSFYQTINYHYACITLFLESHLITMLSDILHQYCCCSGCEPIVRERIAHNTPQTIAQTDFLPLPCDGFHYFIGSCIEDNPCFMFFCLVRIKVP